MSELIGDIRAEDEAIPKTFQREVMRLNRNLGHPGTESLVRALRHAGCKPEVIRWARHHFSDPVRAARARPKPPRPAVLPRALKFNQVIGSDLFFLEFKGEEYIFLNTVCWGTGLQQVEICLSKKSEDVLEAFLHSWVKHYGWPEMIVCDQGPEYTGQAWQDYLGDHGILVHLCDSQSPWQNGRTERAGGALKEQIYDSLRELGECVSPKELVFRVIPEAVAARNAFINRSGFSANQRVFGGTFRMPATLLSDDAVDRLLLSQNGSTEFDRACEIRSAAQKALFRQSELHAVQAALKARSRTNLEHGKSLREGDWCFVWRSNKKMKRRGWVGPGVIICHTGDGRSFWISMRGP